jgi:putative membrane protein
MLAALVKLSPAEYHYPLWTWEPHPEVWLLGVSLIAMYFYVTRVIGPRVVPEGQPIITRNQTRWFVAGVVTLWIAADWPVHDWAEQQLYSIHMVQHLLLTMVIPPMFLLATPRWFAQLILGRGRAYRTFRFLAKPLIAGVLFNAIFAFGHWPAAVDFSVQNGPFHFSEHVAFVGAALLMWMCVCGPFEEMRISSPMQVVYLLSMSILPTVPGGWLVFADGVVYKAYNHPWKVFGLTSVEDQQLAGFIMKVMGGLYLWMVMLVVFFRWQRHDERSEEDRRQRENQAFWAGVEAAVALGLAGSKPSETTVLGEGVLTFDEVAEVFDASAAPAEAEH